MPNVLLVAGVVLIVLYLSRAADSYRHERNAERAVAIVQQLRAEHIDVEIPWGEERLRFTVGVLHGGTYHVGERVPVLVDFRGDDSPCGCSWSPSRTIRQARAGSP